MFLGLILVSFLFFNSWTESTSVSSRDEKYGCVGQDVTLTWTFPGVNISSVEWFYQGASEQLVAVMTHGSFQAMPSFVNKVQYLGDAGIVLKHPTLADRGVYTVEVTGKDTNGQITVERKQTNVHLDGVLPVADYGDLDIEISPHATKNNSTGDWGIELQCGTFTELGSPPAEVVWKMPNGVMRNSSDFRNGNFYLFLSEPVEGGNYVCALSEKYLSNSCLSSLSTLRGESAIHVQSAKAEVAILKAQKEDLININQDLYQGMMSALSNCSSLTSPVHHTFTTPTTTTRTTTEITTVPPSTTTTPRTTTVAPAGACLPGEYVIVDDPTRNVNYSKSSPHLCDKDFMNHTATWYRFFDNGRDAVIPTTCPEKSHCGTSASMWIDSHSTKFLLNNEQINAKACASWDDGCCDWSTDITVRSCGDYFVYNISPLSTCVLRFCTEIRK